MNKPARHFAHAIFSSNLFWGPLGSTLHSGVSLVEIQIIELLQPFVHIHRDNLTLAFLLVVVLNTPVSAENVEGFLKMRSQQKTDSKQVWDDHAHTHTCSCTSRKISQSMSSIFKDQSVMFPLRTKLLCFLYQSMSSTSKDQAIMFPLSVYDFPLVGLATRHQEVVLKLCDLR